MIFTPHSYQEKVVEFFLTRGAAGAFLDPGLGKTASTLMALQILKDEQLISSCLIVAPVRVIYNVWPEEIKKWEFDLTYSILHGSKKDKILKEKVDIQLINPEGLFWLFENYPRKRWDVLVVDESSKFKNHTSKRFKLLKKQVNNFRRRYILTGSPAPNGLLNLFSQILLLDGGNALGRYITHYKNKFFYPSGYGGYTWLPRAGADKEIYKAIEPLVLRMDAKDYLEIPKFNAVKIEMEFDKKVEAKYKELEKEAITELEEKTLAVNSAAALTNKLRQLTGGAVYDENKKVINVHDIKIKALLDLIDELEGQPLLIAYYFKHELARLQKALPKGTPVIGSGVNPKKTSGIIAKWNLGQIPLLLCHPASMGHGLNLQGGGHHAVWYTLPNFDYEVYDQFNRRIYRQGQTKPVFIYHLIVKGTVDEVELTGLKTKDYTQKRLLNALRQQALERG